jgi:hypothetical protein
MIAGEWYAADCPGNTAVIVIETYLIAHCRMTFRGEQCSAFRSSLATIYQNSTAILTYSEITLHRMREA